MKRFLFGLLLCLLCVLSTQAQTHSAGFSYSASVTSGIAGYNIYRASCNGTITGGVCSSEGTFTKVGSNPATTLSYTDNTVTAGASYAYYVTSFCPTTNCSATVGGESGPSNHIATTIPLNPPQPPTGLTLGTVARYVLPNGQTFAAANYYDLPNLPTTYTFSTNGKVLGQGVIGNRSGTYIVTWTGKLGKNQPLQFEVCDSVNNCTSRAIK